MGKGALYNRWRSQTFADILGQEHITRTLQNQIRAGRIAHAYLFTGLRGTGKTSTARIMAKAVNCVGETDLPPCNQCPVCRSITGGRSTDLFEIDGASNRGIDEIRALRENVAFSPSEGRFKVYVIDEVHMLTNEAFNALLKTLEEPPAHVIFILCTTEPHRLPDTVLSRCQRFDFRRGSVTAISAKLRRICEQEGIAISDRALALIARRATGSFRDAESLLDQLSSFGGEEISEQQVQAVLGTVEVDLVLGLVDALFAGDIGSGLAVIARAMDQGAEPRQLLAEIIDMLRALMLTLVDREDDVVAVADTELAHLDELASSGAAGLPKVVDALRRFTDAGALIRTASRPELPVELAFVESVLAQKSGKRGDGDTGERAGAESSASRHREHEKSSAPHQSGQPATSQPSQDAQGESSRHMVREVPAAPAEPVATPQTPVDGPEASADAPADDTVSLSLDWVRGNWNRALSKANAHEPQVAALLQAAFPIRVRGDQITLGCGGDFHRRQLSDDKKRSYVEDLLSDVLGSPCRISCVAAPEEIASIAAGSGTRSADDGAASGGLFGNDVGRRGARAQLRNHPTVKELERRGGIVEEVHGVPSE